MTMQNKSRVSITKALVLVSVSFMMLALLHVNYSTTYPYNGSNESTSPNTGNDASLSPSPNNDNTLEEPFLSPSPKNHQTEHTMDDKNEKDGYPGKVELPKTEPTQPKVDPKIDPTLKVDPTPKKNSKATNGGGVVLSDSSMVTTIRFENGTQYKNFKPEFFKHPEEAKKELGSFLRTLATRSWWIQERLDGEGDDSEIMNDPTTPTNNDETKEDEDDEEEDDERDEKGRSAQVPGRYFGYLPMGGGNNQFTSLQKAAILAKDLNRTLVLPPISPNSHIRTWAGPKYSQFYDLDTFMIASKIPVIEWHDIKQTPELVPGDFNKHWTEFAEDFPCTPNGNIGINDHSLYDKFRLQFLFNYIPVFSKADTTHGKSTDYKWARDVLLKDEETTTPAVVGESDPNLWKCLSCPYFLGGADLSGRSWREVGVHLRFNDKTEAMVDDILDTLLGPKINEDGSEVPASKETFRPHPEFIIIHLRRGDIVSKCPAGKTEEECVVQIEAVAKKVGDIEKQRKAAAEKENRLATYKSLPVLVTTNEKRESELEKLYKLGWILLDHGDEEKDPKTGLIQTGGKTKKLGTETRLGPWYPSMLDAVLLTRGDYLIGMSVSRMSILASQRGKAWHGHTTMLMSQ